MTTVLESLLRLFHEHLADVRFPGIDRAILDAAATRVRDAEAAVAAAALAHEAAQAALRDAADALAAKGQRALAYVKVYAEDQPAIRARLDALDDTQVGAGDPPAPAPRRRGRPPRSERPELIFEAESQASEAPPPA